MSLKRVLMIALVVSMAFNLVLATLWVWESLDTSEDYALCLERKVRLLVRDTPATREEASTFQCGDDV